MRNLVPTVAQPSLAGRSITGGRFVDAGQGRASDRDCAAVRGQSSIDLQLAVRAGAAHYISSRDLSAEHLAAAVAWDDEVSMNMLGLKPLCQASAEALREFLTWSKDSFRANISELPEEFGTRFQIKFTRLLNSQK